MKTKSNMTVKQDNREIKKKEVLKKVYGGERTPSMHDFRLEDGRCKKCGSFIGEKGLILLCKVISPEELKSL